MSDPLDLAPVRARYEHAYRIASTTDQLPSRYKNYAALEAMAVLIAESYSDIPNLLDEIMRLRERVHELERVRLEVEQEVGLPSTIKVWRDGILVFDGVDRVATMTIRCTSHIYAAFDGTTYENCIRCGARR